MTTIGGHFTWSLTTFIGLLNQRLRYFDGATYIRRLWSVIQRWRNAEIQTYILFPPNQWFLCAPFLKLCGHAILSVLGMCRFLMSYLIKTRGGGSIKKNLIKSDCIRSCWLSRSKCLKMNLSISVIFYNSLFICSWVSVFQTNMSHAVAIGCNARLWLITQTNIDTKVLMNLKPVINVSTK